MVTEKKEHMIKALTISPISTVKEMLTVHKYFIQTRLEAVFGETHSLQSSIKDFNNRIPDGLFLSLSFERYVLLGFNNHNCTTTITTRQPKLLQHTRTQQ